MKMFSVIGSPSGGGTAKVAAAARAGAGAGGCVESMANMFGTPNMKTIKTNIIFFVIFMNLAKQKTLSIIIFF